MIVGFEMMGSEARTGENPKSKLELKFREILEKFLPECREADTSPCATHCKT